MRRYIFGHPVFAKSEFFNSYPAFHQLLATEAKGKRKVVESPVIAKYRGTQGRLGVKCWPVMDFGDVAIENPQLHIDYSPQLTLDVTCTEVEGISVGIESRFDVTCRVLYAGGHCEYVSGGLLFFIEGAGSFAAFAEALRNVQRGEASSATLKNVGEEFVLTLSTVDRIFRHVQITVDAREYAVGTGGFTTAHLAVDADYDLYVNKFSDALAAFVRDLRKFARISGTE